MATNKTISPVKYQESILEALEFLNQAVDNLDQAFSCLKDINLAGEMPVPGAVVVWPNKTRDRAYNALDVQELLIATEALRQELSKPEYQSQEKE